jgi:hypothetical protein
MALCCGSMVLTLPEQASHRGTESMQSPADSLAILRPFPGCRIAWRCDMVRVTAAIATARWTPAEFEDVSTALVKYVFIGRMLQLFDESEDLFLLHWFERSITSWLHPNVLRHCDYVDQAINLATCEKVFKCLSFSSCKSRLLLMAALDGIESYLDSVGP